MKTVLFAFALLAAVFLVAADAASLPHKQLDEEDMKEMELSLINDFKALIEMDLYELDDKARDGFLSNLSAAITNAIETIRGRLPSMPDLLNRPSQAINSIQAALAEDSDKKRK